MWRDDVLVCEISGKRPGTSKQRPTEKYAIEYDKCIISNNSEGYETDWEIVNVPEDYRNYYIENLKNSDNAWYAPMNRSYAIKYARERGYKYLIQLDDNIKSIDIAYVKNLEDGKSAVYRSGTRHDAINDFIDFLVTVLENTNAGMAGMNMSGIGTPSGTYLSECFCYSFFALKLDIVPDEFHGDFEDDIEYRLKLAQMGIPTIQAPWLRYSKTGQGGTKDQSGCRKEYIAAGVKRGEHMRKLYGDVYSCGMVGKANTTAQTNQAGRALFKHRLKPVKVGIMVRNRKAIDEKALAILKKYAKPVRDECKVKVKRVKTSGKTEQRDRPEAI